MKVSPWIPFVGLAAGLLDASTGLILITLPVFTARLMGIGLEAVPVPSLRFLGAFVLAVGTLYLWGFRQFRHTEWTDWLSLWRATAWIRLCVGGVVLGQILLGELEQAWISVPLSDLGLALFQALTARRMISIRANKAS